MSGPLPFPDADADARQERFLALFLPVQGTVRAFIRSIVWDRGHCDDLFQEVALVLWRELDRYDGQRPFGAWARGVAGKTVLKSLRQARRAPVALSPEAIVALEVAFGEGTASGCAGALVPGSAPPDHPAAAAGETERPSSREEDALRHCLEKLPDRARSLVSLRYRDSLKVADIATKVMSSPEAVQKALSRLRESLQKCVEKRLRAAT